MRTLLIAYNNDSYIHYFPHALAYLAGSLRQAGHTVEIYNQDINHWPDSHLTQFLDENHFDVIGIGVSGGYYQYRRLLSISKAINASKNRPFFIIGGHCVSPDPEYFLRKTNADVIIMGEGEITILDLLETLEFNNNKNWLYDIKGIAFWETNCRGSSKIIINERREVIKHLDDIPFPAYDLFPMEYYRLIRYPYTAPNEFSMSMISGRGCPYQCNFCYRLDTGFRPRTNESIIDEMRYFKNTWNIKNIYFFDELLMSSKERSINLSQAIKKANLDMKWSCNGRLNFASLDVLKIMKDSGCVFINYGIEAMDNEVLRLMNKGLTTDIIIKGVENTLAVGISNGLNLMWGNLGDSQETLDKAVEFLIKYDDGVQLRTIRPVTPYPGSPLYYYAIEKGYIKDCEDFYERVHVNSDLVAVNFIQDKMTTKEMHKALYEANKILLDNYYEKQKQQMILRAADLYLKEDASFRGFRPQ